MKTLTLLFLTAGLASAGLVIDGDLVSDTTSRTIAPGQTLTVYLNTSSYQTFSATHPELSAPALPDRAGFVVRADVSSVGGSLQVRLLDYAGASVLADLGTVTLNPGSWNSMNFAFAYSAITPISSGDQNALFNSSCPATGQFTGFASSMCIGWFRADVTNTGAIPIVLLPDVTPRHYVLVGVGLTSVATGAVVVGTSGVPAYGGNAAYGTTVP